ncbi:MAG: FliG C-terminal domain-containing protein [bacterium]
MSGKDLTEEEVTRLVELLLEEPAEKRDFLLDIFRRQASDFYRRLEGALPAIDDFFDWDPRLLQQLIRDLSFRDMAWAFLGDDSDIIKLIGENISRRGRMILMEEIQAVKEERRRKLESNKVKPEQLEQLKQRKIMLVKLKAQRLVVSEDEAKAAN